MRRRRGEPEESRTCSSISIPPLAAASSTKMPTMGQQITTHQAAASVALVMCHST